MPAGAAKTSGPSEISNWELGLQAPDRLEFQAPPDRGGERVVAGIVTAQPRFPDQLEYRNDCFDVR